MDPLVAGGKNMSLLAVQMGEMVAQAAPFS